MANATLGKQFNLICAEPTLPSSWYMQTDIYKFMKKKIAALEVRRALF